MFNQTENEERGRGVALSEPGVALPARLRPAIKAQELGGSSANCRVKSAERLRLGPDADEEKP